MSVEIITQEKLNVRIGSSVAPFQGLEHVSRSYRQFVSALNVGSSRAPSCVIETSGGVVVGRVSYNGRVWEGGEYTPDADLLYCPSVEAA